MHIKKAHENSDINMVVFYQIVCTNLLAHTISSLLSLITAMSAVFCSALRSSAHLNLHTFECACTAYINRVWNMWHSASITVEYYTIRKTIFFQPYSLSRTAIFVR